MKSYKRCELKHYLKGDNQFARIMLCSWIFLRASFVKTDVSEEYIAYIIRVTTILAILMMKAIFSSETSVLTGATRHNREQDVNYCNRVQSTEIEKYLP
jgi:hypothetical protein